VMMGSWLIGIFQWTQQDWEGDDARWFQDPTRGMMPGDDAFPMELFDSAIVSQKINSNKYLIGKYL
jgi:hypothetical protein